MRTWVFFGIVMMAASACTGEFSADLRKLEIDAPASAQLPVSIAVLDLRSLVVKGRKPPHWLGEVYAGFRGSNSPDFPTASGKPLASEISAAFARALRPSKVFETSITDLPDDLISRFTSNPGNTERLLLLELTEWEIDSIGDYWFSAQGKLSIFDRTGKLLASENIESRELVDRALYSTASRGRKYFLSETEKYLNQLLNSGKIAANLK